MNGITHKQAIQWIDRRLDGLLNDSQLVALGEHLRSCDSCSAYAADMDGLSARVKNGLNRRWNEKSGPSQDGMEHVIAKATNIPLRRRIASGVKLLAGVTTLIMLGFLINLMVSRLQGTSTSAPETETANNSAPAENRLLAFASDQTGNSDVYLMRADGSTLINLTNHPAIDTDPFWSPDGNQIAFLSDRDGSPQIYLMEANGSHLIRLTQGDGNYFMDVNGFSPWSPDGRKLIYSYRSPEETRWNLYIMDIAEKTSTALTSEPGEYILPSWSPDGRHVAFTAESDRVTTARDLFIIGSNGSNLVKITENLSAGEIFVFGNYSWSQDGMSITFSTHSYGPVGQSSAYEASLDGSLTVLARTDKFMIDWWNGTTLQEDSEAKTLTWLRSDSSQSTLNLCQSDDSLQGIAYKRSNDGNLVFGSNCSNRGWMLYWANSDGTIVNELLGSPIPANGNTDHIFNMTWSPDDRYLVFVALHTDANSDGSTTLYILDIAKARNDPSLQPLKMTNSSGPSWQPVDVESEVDNSPELKIDPQSCKSTSELDSALRTPDELYGYKLVQGTSYVDGDFSYEVWLYCDPSIQPEEQRNLNTIAGLGIFASWKYTGPQQEGHTEYYFAFEQDALVHGGSWDGPIYNASLTGARFGIHLPKLNIVESIRQGIPIPFYAVIYSPLGQKSATFSFSLEPSDNGLSVVDLQATKKVLTSQPTQSASSEILPPIGTGVSNGEWIAFIGGEMIPNPADLAAPTLNYDVYMIHPDGSELTNLTQFPAYYHHLQWSPNGQSLLFMRENPGRNDVTIMRHFAGLETGYFEVTPIVDPDQHGYSWSPNSDKIVFASASSGNYDIYTMYADGRPHPELTQLTNDPADDVGFVWSPDGSQIAYQRVDGENLSIVVMDADGSNQHEVARGVGVVRLHWSMDGKSIYASSVRGWPPESQDSYLECEACVPGPAVYQIDLNGPSVQQIYTEEDASKVMTWYMYDTPQNSFYFMRINPPVFVELWGTWFRADGNSVTEIGEMDPQHTCESTSGNILNEYISPNPRFSVISNFCAFGFDLYLADREASTLEKKFIHLLQLPLETSGQGGDSATVPMMWSPDGRWLIYDDGNQSFYLLDVEQILREPTTEPAILFKSDSNVFEFSEVAWQPAP